MINAKENKNANIYNYAAIGIKFWNDEDINIVEFMETISLTCMNDQFVQ
jgi:hypothetical protein